MRRDEEKKKQSEKENGERDTVTMGWGEKKKEKKKIENAWKYVIPNTYPWNLHFLCLTKNTCGGHNQLGFAKECSKGIC